MSDPVRADDSKRIAAGGRYAIRSVAADPFLDGIAELAARSCGAALAKVAFFDREAQWVLGGFGCPLGRVPWDADCEEALRHPAEVFEFSGAAAKQGGRFRASAPIHSPEGSIVGVIWVEDPAYRSLSAGQRESLRCLAVIVTNELERRSRSEGGARPDRSAAIAPAPLVNANESDVRFRTLADNIAQFAWMADARGWIFWYNQRWFDYTGTTLEEMQGWGWRKVHHPDHVDRVVAKISECFEIGEPWEDTFPLRGRDGVYRWFLSRAIPVRNEAGDVIRWFGTNTDITEQRAAEQALRENEERFRRVANAMPQIVFMTDGSGRNHFLNEQWSDYTGMAVDASLGRGWRAAVHPDDLPGIARQWQRALESGQAYEMKYRLRHRNGQYRWQLARALPLRAPDGMIKDWIGTTTDIHEAEQGRLALRRASDALELAQTASDSGVWDWDIQTDDLYVSPEYRRLYGIDERTPATYEYWLAHLVHPADRERMAEARRELFASGTEYNVEFRIVHPGRGERWITGRGTLTRDALGRPARFTGINFDITERKRAEAAAVEAAARLKAVVETAVDGILTLDEHGAVETVNPAVERIFGYTADEIVGRNVDCLLAEPSLREYDGFLATGEQRLVGAAREVRGRRKDGSDFPLDVSLSEINLEGRRLFTGILRDVTVRKRAEELLKQQANMLELSHEAMFVWELGGPIIYWNRGATELYGYPPAEALGRSSHALLQTSATDDFTAILVRDGHWVGELRQRTRDGRFVTVESRHQLIVEPGGRRVVLETNRDITERKRIEAVLTDAKRAADRANEAKSQFLANMSHEIRSPLTGVLGYADILRDRLKDPKNIECVDTIRESGRALLEIINDILDLSTIEAGALAIEMQRFSLNVLLSQVRSLMSELAKEKGLQLLIRLNRLTPPLIETDRKRVRQILINLLSNAIKFTDAGRVDLEVDYFADRSLLRFSVTDTGIGIPKEQIDRLFQPFSQVDNSGSRRHEGSGLGLAITKRLLDLLGGAIMVSSEPGHGSTFSFTLPVKVPEGDVPQKRADNYVLPKPRGRRLTARVLVVDDRPEIGQLIRRMIWETGARVRVVDSGAAALKAVRRHRVGYDVIFMDVQMPGMNGYETMRQLRAKGFHGPIVALTAAAMAGEREKCLAAGFDEYLSKPIEKDILLDLLERIVENEFKTASGRDPGETSMERETTAGASAASPAPGRVLLVDDSDVAVRAVKGLLELSDYSVEVALDGKTALEIAQNYPADFVLLDIRLRDMTGYDLFTKLKALPALERSRFVALSGYGDEERDRALAFGFDHYMMKPFDLDAFLALAKTAGSPA